MWSMSSQKTNLELEKSPMVVSIVHHDPWSLHNYMVPVVPILRNAYSDKTRGLTGCLWNRSTDPTPWANLLHNLDLIK
jgi:hypothetical protein